jgi:hypothetical protein
LDTPPQAAAHSGVTTAFTTHNTTETQLRFIAISLQEAFYP